MVHTNYQVTTNSCWGWVGAYGVLDQFVSQGGKNLVLLGSRCKNDTVKIDNMFLFDGGKSG